MSPRRLISTATEAVGVAAHQVDRADRGRELATYQGQAVGQGRGVVGEQLLQVLLDAVLLQAGVDAEFVRGVVQHLLDQDAQRVVVLAVTIHSGTPSSVIALASVHGGDIQFSGLYEPPSEWTSTEPSFLTMISRVAIGRWAVSRPA